MIKRLIWIIAIPIFLSACKKELFQFNFSERTKLTVQELDYDYIQAKSRISYDDGLKKINANATIRMRRDSLIWVSISPAVGVEAIRAMVSKDSVYVLDRLNKTYRIYSIDSLSKQFNIYMDFKMLESALLGNLMVQRDGKDKVIKNDEFYILNQNQYNLEISNFVNANTMKIQKIHMIEKPSMNSMDIDFADFQVVDENLISFEKSFTVNYTSGKSSTNTLLDINFSKINIDNKKIKFPFNIPGKYVSN